MAPSDTASNGGDAVHCMGCIQACRKRNRAEARTRVHEAAPAASAQIAFFPSSAPHSPNFTTSRKRRQGWHGVRLGKAGGDRRSHLLFLPLWSNKVGACVEEAAVAPSCVSMERPAVEHSLSCCRISYSECQKIWPGTKSIQEVAPKPHNT